MGASDFMVGNAPGGVSYAAPNMSAQLMQGIGSAPADYMQGRQFARQRAIQDAFPNGIPTRPDGSPDTAQIMSTMGRIGGGEYIQGLMPYLLQQQADAPINSLLSGRNSGSNGGAPAPAPAPSYPSPARNTPAATGPASLATQAPMQQAPMSSTGMDDTGQETIRTFIGSMGGAKDMSGTIGTVAGSLQLNPDKPLSPAESARVGAYVRTNAAKLGIPGAGQKTAQAQQPVPSQEAQTAQESDPTLGGLIPQTWISDGHTASEYRDVLAAAAARPNVSDSPKAVALQRIKFIDEALGQSLKLKEETAERNKQLSNEEKNARNPAVAAAKKEEEWNKQDVDRYSKQATGIDSQAAAADSMRTHLQLAKGIFNNPQFYSGTGEGINLAYKRAIAAFGGDPNASLPQEAFRKIMAANILDQVANLKAETAASGGATRIFQSQIQLMEKAAQNPDNSIAANRLLTEIGIRLADRATQIADLKAGYKNGHIDSQFNTQLRLWNRDHPVFTPDELQHLDRIAPPEFNSFKDAYNAKMKPGTPVKVNGKLVFAQEPK
jgi:hypothetical protein